MSSYVIRVNENNFVGKKLIDYLKSLSETSNYIEVMPQKAAKKMNGLDEAIEDIKKGRITTYENYEEYEKATHQMLGYV